MISTRRFDLWSYDFIYLRCINWSKSYLKNESYFSKRAARAPSRPKKNWTVRPASNTLRTNVSVVSNKLKNLALNWQNTCWNSAHYLCRKYWSFKQAYVLRFQTIRLPPPYKSKCGERQLASTDSYSYSACLMECWTRVMTDRCQCKTPEMVQLGEKLSNLYYVEVHFNPVPI